MDRSGQAKHLPGGSLLVILLCSVTLSLMYSPGTVDVPGWQEWYQNVYVYGLRDGYARSCADYPPLTYVVLFILAQLAEPFSLESFLAIKWSIALFHLLTTLIFWAYARDLVLVSVFHLSLLLNTVLLGYVDIYFAPFLLLSLWGLQCEKMLLFSVCFSCAYLTKWQPVIIAPFLLLYLLQIKQISQWKQIQFQRLALWVLLPAMTMLLIAAGFFQWALWESFLQAISHDQLSAYALNLNWVSTYLLKVFFPEYWGHLSLGRVYIVEIDLLDFAGIVPKILFLAAYTLLLLSFFKQEKTFEKLIVYSLVGYYAYFTLNTGVHENHLFLPCVLSAVLLRLDRAYIAISAFIIVMMNINLLAFYGIDGELRFSRVVLGLDMTVLLAVVNTIFFIWMFWCLMRARCGLNGTTRGERTPVL